MVPKKLSLTEEQIKFIKAFSIYGFKDQSEMIRTALDEFMINLKRQIKNKKLQQEALKFVSMYSDHKELTYLTDLDSEDFNESK